MKPITVSRDPLLQKVVKFHDLNDGRFAVETIYDAQQVKDANTYIRNDQPAGWKHNEHLVGRIPMVLWQQLQTKWKEQGLGYAERQRAMKAFLNDPDNAIFRTKSGRL